MQLDPSKPVSTRIRVLGLDPGQKNFAYSIVEADIHIVGTNKTVHIHPIKCGLLKRTVTNVKTAHTQVNQFLLEIEALTDSNFTALGVEHFQSRGFNTKTIETVNISIGALMATYPHVPIHHFSAASWKNSVNVKCDISEIYRIATCTDHEFDATMIATMAAFRHFGIKPYNGYKQAVLNRILSECQIVSTTPKRVRRPSNKGR